MGAHYHASVSAGGRVLRDRLTRRCRDAQAWADAALDELCGGRASAASFCTGWLASGRLLRQHQALGSSVYTGEVRLCRRRCRP